jgi:polyphosphate glucokinase
MNVLTIDVGGNHVKLMTSRECERRKFDSGPKLDPERMVREVNECTADWSIDAISIGFPGVVVHGRIVAEPKNLGTGWVGYDFGEAFDRPIRLINDAAMQALGSYEGGRMLFLGLGTGLGSAMIVNGVLEPMELAHLPYRRGRTYEDYLGDAGLERMGRKRWREHVWKVVDLLKHALEAEEVVIGGGNVKKLDEMPPGVRAGDNANAFTGGFRLWQDAKNSYQEKTG